ncbi:C2H2 and C2HC zinc fingers superfamily protein [Striga asiatica]|uniref:C2H2 and C2HC zinc fingers superfamily protein n=1 Tax=Striga asiatica TaxID=4170 RepID=A0A5A7RFM4_STRAF|nr:C2H2 and C2HC zinc fingers superfamily protein [Striga asiatica]
MIPFLLRLQLYASQRHVRARCVVAASKVHRLDRVGPAYVDIVDSRQSHSRRLVLARGLVAVILVDDYREYLPCFYSDPIHGIVHDNVTDGNVRNAGFGVVFSKSTYADAVAGPTVDIVYLNSPQAILELRMSTSFEFWR